MAISVFSLSCCLPHKILDFVLQRWDTAKFHAAFSTPLSASINLTRTSNELAGYSVAFIDFITDEPLLKRPQTLMGTIAMSVQPYLVSLASLHSPEPQDMQPSKAQII
jgi:hypothetical protein